MRIRSVVFAAAIAASALLPISASAGGFLPFVVGYSMGQSSRPAGAQQMAADPTSSVLYTADPDVLKTTNAFDVRMIAQRGCWSEGYNFFHGYESLGDLFYGLMRNQPKKKRTVLQITRVLGMEGQPACGAIWFTYVEDKKR